MFCKKNKTPSPFKPVFIDNKKTNKIYTIQKKYNNWKRNKFESDEKHVINYLKWDGKVSSYNIIKKLGIPYIIIKWDSGNEWRAIFNPSYKKVNEKLTEDDLRHLYQQNLERLEWEAFMNRQTPVLINCSNSSFEFFSVKTGVKLYDIYPWDTWTP